MNLFDVNVLVYAHRPESPRHELVRRWLEEELSAPAGFGMSELVLSGFVRLVTNGRIFKSPTPLETALKLVEAIRSRPTCTSIRPGPAHFAEFVRLCRAGRATSKLVPDAYLAALAIESGCTWVTFDRDFARFPGLDWAEPDLGQ